MFRLLILAVFRECLYTKEVYGVNKACRTYGTLYRFTITISVYDIKKGENYTYKQYKYKVLIQIPV